MEDGLLFEKDKVLQDDFLFLFEGLGILELGVVAVEEILDQHDEQVAYFHPVALHLTIACDVFDHLSQL